VSNWDEYGSNCESVILSDTGQTIVESSRARRIFTGQIPSAGALAAASEPRGIGTSCISCRVLGFDRKLAAVWHLPF
jgi:hypothetical protein